MTTSSPALFSLYADLRLGGPRETSSNIDSDPTEASNGLTFNGRLCDITQIWLSDNEPGDCHLTDQIAAPRSTVNKRFGPNSLLLRRNVHKDKKPVLELEIQSDLLQNVIRAVCPHLSTLNIHTSPIVVKAPYHELYHFRKEIAATAAAADLPISEEKRLKKEINTLENFLHESLGRAIDGIESLTSAGQISMDYLWAIFKPGEHVLLRRQDTGGRFETLCGVLRSFFNKKDADGNVKWCLKVLHMTFERGRFGAIEEVFQFPAFVGQVAISALPAYPLAYCADRAETVKDLVRRGKAFIELCRNAKGLGAPTHMTYCGSIWIQRERWETKGCEFFDAPERTVGFSPIFTALVQKCAEIDRQADRRSRYD